MKAIFVADLHIKLGQKNVPVEWQKERFFSLADELNKIDADYVIIGGDLLDVANPSLAEVGLMYDFLKRLRLDGIIIPGNHEMTTKTKDCFSDIESLVENTGFRVIREFETVDGIDYIPYNILFKKFPKPQSNIAITHVRGEIPPHVEPEVPLEKFSGYDKVFAGDLHSYANSQANILYPGSPFATSFHRNVPTKSNGLFIIDTTTGEHTWHELKLPQLIRTKVSSVDEMVSTDFHHTIYELEGSLEDLAKVKNTELLDKKVVNDIVTPPTLDLSGDIAEEVSLYLREVKGIDDPSPYVSLFMDIINDTD
jgi:DNA repair exonuclease SbcCD nuclease subunit